MDSHLYDEYYYAHDCGRPYQRDDHWLNFFDQIAARIIEHFEPRSVLDAGCAWGFLVEAFRNRGVDAFGVDISDYAIKNVHPDIQSYCRIGSITEPFSQKYDLITCIEVLEHMPQADAEKAIENICSHADAVIFSSTPFDYKEVTHFNVHAPEYWAEQFARHGFYRDIEADLSYITAWAGRFVVTKQSTVVLVREYERKFWEFKKENYDLRQLSFEMQNTIKLLENEIQGLNSQLAEKEQVNQALSGKFIENKHAMQNITTKLEEINASRAWKFLQPLRRLYARLRSK